MNTPDNKAMNTPDNDSGGFGGLLAVAGGVLVMVACCAGPALIAGGMLALSLMLAGYRAMESASQLRMA